MDSGRDSANCVRWMPSGGVRRLDRAGVNGRLGVGLSGGFFRAHFGRVVGVKTAEPGSRFGKRRDLCGFGGCWLAGCAVRRVRRCLLIDNDAAVDVRNYCVGRVAEVALALDPEDGFFSSDARVALDDGDVALQQREVGSPVLPLGGGVGGNGDLLPCVAGGDADLAGERL